MKKSTTIQCIGFIMDGNRRWAKAQGLPTLLGHKRGGEVFMKTLEWVHEAGIPHAVYYAFSTENWNRSEEEVSYLMDQFRELLSNLRKKLTRESASFVVRVIGRREDFPFDVQAQMTEIEKVENTSMKSVVTVWIALSYGGRAEIVSAVNQAILQGNSVTETTFEQLLWTAKLPDPDLIVRTGGEERLSNFLTWRSVYSELLFLDTYWPALTKDDFIGILEEYESRERRKGI